MTRTDHLLVILMEECAEVSQRASKALRFGLQEVQPGQLLTNADRLVVEINDVLAVVEMLDKTLTSFVAIGEPRPIDDKQAKVEQFLEYSKQCGTLEGP